MRFARGFASNVDEFLLLCYLTCQVIHLLLQGCKAVSRLHRLIGVAVAVAAVVDEVVHSVRSLFCSEKYVNAV